MDCSPPGFPGPWDFQGKNTVSFSRGSSGSRDETGVFCVAGNFFTPEPQTIVKALVLPLTNFVNFGELLVTFGQFFLL